MNINRKNFSDFTDLKALCQFSAVSILIVIVSLTIATTVWAQAIPRRVTTIQPGSPTVVVPAQPSATPTQVQNLLQQQQADTRRLLEEQERKRASERGGESKRLDRQLERINLELGIDPRKDRRALRLTEREDTRERTIRELLIDLNNQVQRLTQRVGEIERTLDAKKRSLRKPSNDR